MKYNTTWLRWKGNCSTQLLLIGHERTSWVESYVIVCHLRNVLYCTRGNITLLMTLHYRLLLTDLQTRYEEENKLAEVIMEIDYIRLRQSTAVWGMGHGPYTNTDNTVLYTQYSLTWQSTNLLSTIHNYPDIQVTEIYTKTQPNHS